MTVRNAASRERETGNAGCGAGRRHGVDWEQGRRSGAAIVRTGVAVSVPEDGAVEDEREAEGKGGGVNICGVVCGGAVVVEPLLSGL